MQNYSPENCPSANLSRSSAPNVNLHTSYHWFLINVFGSWPISSASSARTAGSSCHVRLEIRNSTANTWVLARRPNVGPSCKTVSVQRLKQQENSTPAHTRENLSNHSPMRHIGHDAILSIHKAGIVLRQPPQPLTTGTSFL